jgi:hypothetical protein
MLPVCEEVGEVLHSPKIDFRRRKMAFDSATALSEAKSIQTTLNSLINHLTPDPVPIPSTTIPKFGTANGWRLTNPASNGGRDSAGQDFEIGLCVDLGAKIVRIGEGSTLGVVVTKLFDRGLKPLIIFGGNPVAPWTTSATSLASRASNIAGLYGDNVIYECLNEPNIHGWTPDAYLPYLKAFHDAVKSKSPNAIVLNAGLWSGSSSQALIPWTERFVSLGGLNYTDYFNVHLYDDPAEHGAWSIWDMTYGSNGAGFYDAKNVRTLIGNKPIISTESGGPIPKYTASKQATIVTNALKAADGVGTAYRKTALTLIYNVLDDDVAGFGMLDANKIKRPSYTAYQVIAKV